MTFWEFLGIALSSAGLFASVLGAFLTYAARQNGRATRDLIRSMEEGTRDVIRSIEERTTDVVGRMDQRADARHAEVIQAFERMEKHLTEVLERMDRRADERHREVIQAIGALGPT